MKQDDKEVLLVAQDIKLAKILAGNNPKLRHKTVKLLGKWLKERLEKSPVTEDVFMRIWKGLFYTMWMSDKPLPQEMCAENISQLVHLPNAEQSLLFFKCFLQTMVNEWFGIDQHRIDKFLMLVRRVLRQTFEVLKENEWQIKLINTFREILNATAMKIDKTTAIGLVYHLDDIYLEELAKVSRGKVSSEVVLELLQPFVQQLARSDDTRQTNHVVQHVFRHLMEQTDLGIEYKEKFHSWRRQGFPGGTMDALEKVEIENSDDEAEDEQNNKNSDDSENEDDDNEPKDPRAGKVDVILPQIPFDPLELAELLTSLKNKSYTTTLGRKKLNILSNQLTTLSQGRYPLGSKKIATVKADGYSMKLKSSLKRLHNFEQKMNKDSKKTQKKQLKKKKIKEILEEQVNEIIKNQPKEEKKEKITENGKPKEKGNKKRQTSSFEDFVKMSEAHLFNSTATSKKRKVSPVYEEFLSDEFEQSGLKGRGQKKRKFIPEKQDKKKGRNSLGALDNLPTKNSNSFVRNSGIWMVEEFDVPESPVSTPEKKKTNSEWSKPLSDGETEYFVVSSKAKKKLKRITQAIIREKSSTSPKLSKKGNTLVKNPFSITNDTPVKSKLSILEALKTPKSEKKIKFSTLNHSQDFSEHLQQLISSPAVPFDAKKHPSKSLLKPSPMSSPINALHFKKIH